MSDDDLTGTSDIEDPVAEASTLRSRPAWRPGAVLAAAVLSGALALAPEATSSAWRRRDENQTESSTSAVEESPELAASIRQLFDEGAEEFFQDGIQSQFARKLLTIVTRYRGQALRAIGDYVFSGRTSPDVVSESLRRLAEVDDPGTLAERWFLLQRTLEDRSPKVRDGAILGFATLDDPNSIDLLRRARERESIEQLKRLIDDVVRQLNETADAANSPHS